MITLISMLEVLLFLLSICTFILNHLDLKIYTTIKKIYIEIMPSSTPHQKFSFYHLPTQGRVGIKLGEIDMSPVVSIIFDCSMPIFYNLHILLATFYTIFETNILIQCPVPVPVCCIFFISQ